MEEKSVRTRTLEMVASSEARARYFALFACVAVIVAIGAALVIRQQGVAMVREVQVLDCTYAGNGAHTHNADCYDEGANLVCPLEQKEYHQHDDSCYEEERTLICGLEEREAHVHDDSCYDDEGNLICGFDENGLHVHSDSCYDEESNLICGFDENGIHTHTDECYDKKGKLVCTLPEGEPHTHTDDCYEVTRTLVCEKEETTEEHVHGPGCFRTVYMNQDGNEIDASSLEEAQQIEEAQRALEQEDAATEEEVSADEEKATQDAEGAAADEEADPDEDGAAADEEGTEEEPTDRDIESASDKAAANESADAEDAADDAADDKDDKDDKDDGKGADDAAAADAKDDADDKDDAIDMPAQTFESELLDDDGKLLLRAHVDAPEGAFPAGTSMIVRPIESDKVNNLVKETAETETRGQVTQVQLVDITFYDADGNEIEPAVNLTVRFSSDLIEGADETLVVHVDDEGEASVAPTLDAKELKRRSETVAKGEIAFDVTANEGELAEDSSSAKDAKDAK